KTGSTLLLRALPHVAAERVLLVGLGAKKEFGEAAYRDAVRTAANALRELGAKDAALFLVDLKVKNRSLSWNLRQAVLGIREAVYRFDELKQKKSPAPSLERVTPPLPPAAQLAQALAEARATAAGADLTRTPGNLPSNMRTPRPLADQAKHPARESKRPVDVL